MTEGEIQLSHDIAPLNGPRFRAVFHWLSLVVLYEILDKILLFTRSYVS